VFTLSLRDGANAMLAGLPARLRNVLMENATQLAAELEARIQQKLGGEVLRSRSGALARSIGSTVEVGADGVTVEIATGGDVKYAAIHEFGGTIPPHEILPDKARALAFVLGGKQVFATRVNIPAVTMPERSYLRSSLAEMADQIREELSEALGTAID
jgi:phage gpG-like protein